MERAAKPLSRKVLHPFHQGGRGHQSKTEVENGPFMMENFDDRNLDNLSDDQGQTSGNNRATVHFEFDATLSKIQLNGEQNQLMDEQWALVEHEFLGRIRDDRVSLVADSPLWSDAQTWLKPEAEYGHDRTTHS